jgi:hypothetical protein
MRNAEHVSWRRGHISGKELAALVVANALAKTDA